MNLSPPTFLRSLSIQRRVLYALMMREIITRFGRDNIGVLWLVAEPMLFTLGITTLWTAAGLHDSSAIPVVAFAVTGYSSVLMWRNSATRASVVIAQNKQLLFHRNVKVIDALLIRIMLEIAGATSSFLLLSLAFIYVGWMPLPVDLLRVMSGWAMLAWFGGSLALLIGAGTAFSEIVERLWHPVAYILFPMSGAAFMVDWLPNAMQRVVLLLPMVHGVEMVRDGFFGNLVHTHHDLRYMAVCCMVMTFAGLCLVREAVRRMDN